MIGWLEGSVQQLWQRGGRRGVLLNCGGVGYEVVLHQRCHDGLSLRCGRRCKGSRCGPSSLRTFRFATTAGRSTGLPRRRSGTCFGS